MNFSLAPMLALVLPAIAVAQTVTVQLVPNSDNTLYEDAAGALSNGSGQYLFVGRTATGSARRALLSFDVVANIPTRSRIVDVQLTMMVRQSNATAVTGVTLHRVTRSWGEGASVAAGGEGGGAPAAVGDATWLHAMFPATNWGSAGGDYRSAPSSEADMPLQGAFAFDKTVAMLADVQEWLNGMPNHGWLLRTDELVSSTARKLDSRDNSTANAAVPVLSVTYLPPGGITAFGVGCSTSANMNMSQAVTGAVAQGSTAVLTVQSGVPQGLFVTLLSYDVLPTPLQPASGCLWWLREIPYPHLGIRVQDAAGVSVQNLPIPINSALFGVPMAMQSVMVDFAHPRQWALSNAELICIN